MSPRERILLEIGLLWEAATMSQKEKPASIFTPADLSYELLIDYEQMT